MILVPAMTQVPKLLDLPLTRSLLPSHGSAACTDATRKCYRCTQNQGISRRLVPRPVPRVRRGWRTDLAGGSAYAAPLRLMTLIALLFQQGPQVGRGSRRRIGVPGVD